MGKPSLSDGDSFRLKERTDHWRREIVDAFNAGKTVIIFLENLQEVYVATGEKTYSGTGRNRATTRIVTGHTNYAAIPISLSPVNSTGTSMHLTKEAEVIKTYWTDFGALSQYKVRLEGEVKRPLVVTKTGNKPVGAIVTGQQGGHLLHLPYFSFEDEAYYKESKESDTGLEWTKEAIILSRKFLSDVIEIDKVLRSRDERTPTPDWALESSYVLPREVGLQEQGLKIESEISRLQEERKALKERLQAEGSLRNLLYEKGAILEAAILEGLRLLGFTANNYKGSESEFDAVFESPEGRFLGEAEGKDNVPVNVDKIRQLEMNIQEDYAREGVETIAKGVLFGNAFRLIEPGARTDFFTKKCMSAALRSGIALVRTPDLFTVCQYLSATKDSDFARGCREAIFSAAGEVVVFPSPPAAMGTITETESAKNT